MRYQTSPESRHGQPIAEAAHRHEMDRTEAEWGRHIDPASAGAGEGDERSHSLASDLADVESARVLHALPSQGTRDEDDMGRAALLAPTGRKHPDGSDVTLGDDLYGRDGGWRNGPTTYELQRRHEAAKEAVVSTAHLDADTRSAVRTATLRQAEFYAAYGDRHDEGELRAAIVKALAHTPMIDPSFNAAVAAALGAERIDTAPATATPAEPKGDEFVNEIADLQRRIGLI